MSPIDSPSLRLNSTWLAGLSLGLIGPLLVCLWWLERSATAWYLVFACIAVLLAAAYVFFMPTAVTLGDEHLLIKRLFGAKKVPLTSLSKVMIAAHSAPQLEVVDSRGATVFSVHPPRVSASELVRFGRALIDRAGLSRRASNDRTIIGERED